MKIKHNGSRTRLYHIYYGMMHRCYKPKCKEYKRYGGRGIKMCNEWIGKDGFVTFRDWALKNGYSNDLSIDRIDNNGGYTPQNCRWVTDKIQKNNMSSNTLLTYNGETHTISEWSDITGIKAITISTRKRYGWSDEDTLVRPVQSHAKSNPATKWIRQDKYGFALVIKNNYIGRFKTLEEAVRKRDLILYGG